MKTIASPVLAAQVHSRLAALGVAGFVPAPPVLVAPVIGGKYHVTISPLSGSGFFRLVSP